MEPHGQSEAGLRRDGRPTRMAAWLMRALLPVLLLCGARSAHAICLRGPTPHLLWLGELVGRDPQAALDQASARVDAAARLRLPQAEIAWLRAIQADAYDNLSLPDAARRAALEGMTVMPDVRHPAHVELLTEYAYNGFDAAEIDRSIPLVKAARLAQRPGSAADVCLVATLGHLLRMRDRPDQAVSAMMRAYRASMRPGLEEQRIFVAAAFSILMRYAGDWDQALALNQEGIDWSVAKRRTHDVADFRFKGGWILVRQGRYEQALEQFRIAREMRRPFHDVVNDAYIDLETCEAQLNLARFAQARATCADAERIFADHGDASRGQARLLIARIALGQHRPREALALLTALLHGRDAQSASVNAAKLHLYRAQALAALGRRAEAYVDLDRYVDLNARWNETEGAKQATILRARFDTDREIDHNRALLAALGFAQEREREQRRRTMILLAFGGVFIVLLGYIVLADRRNRRRLLLVASSDGLTGLLNRKWVADRGAALLAQPPRRGHPLSVALIDLDHFKSINDTHGHAAGDAVLRQFAEAARKIVRTTDILGRWGGEEFLLILPDTSIVGAFEVVERLRASAATIRLPFQEDLTIRFSAGLALRTDEHMLDELVAKADLALYRAKARGRDASCFYGRDGAGETMDAGTAPTSVRPRARRTEPGRLVDQDAVSAPNRPA